MFAKYRAVVALMSYPGLPIWARVDSVGWGITKQDGSTGFDLLQRSSQRSSESAWHNAFRRGSILGSIPDGVDMDVGTAASVLVMAGTAGSDQTGPATVAPSALQ